MKEEEQRERGGRNVNMEGTVEKRRKEHQRGRHSERENKDTKRGMNTERKGGT
jgi:hypothetical protein